MSSANEKLPAPGRSGAGQGLAVIRPASARPHDLVLGWAKPAGATVGFRQPGSRPEPRVLTYRGDGHVAVFARTGAGKGRSCTIPWLLRMPNSAVVLDVKAEAYHCTARVRRERFGHRVVVLDPFDVCGGEDALNPFELIRPDRIDTDADALTELLLDGRPQTLPDPFWDNCARAFLVGCVAHIAATGKPGHPGQLRDLLLGDDVTRSIAVALDEGKVEEPVARREFVTFLNHEREKVRTSVLSTAQQALRVVASDRVVKSLSRTTFDLELLQRGDPITIYLVIPPENLASHGVLLRLWIGVLLQLVTRRQRRPKHNTLFFLDEIAQCGTLPILRQVITLLRGYGVTAITLWQDLSQLQALYPDWRTLLNNCGAILAFGASTFEMARAAGAVLGAAPERLRSLAPDDAVAAVAGHEPITLRRLDYLRDRIFKGRFEANPWFATASDRGVRT